MLEQLKIINNCHKEIEEIHKRKIERLYQQVMMNVCKCGRGF